MNFKRYFDTSLNKQYFPDITDRVHAKSNNAIGKMWKKITDQNVPTTKCLVTNLIHERDKNGKMYHVWIVPFVYKEAGQFATYPQFPSLTNVINITHFCEIPMEVET